MKTLITICVRGGSKGIPGKNIKMLGGKPLIYYSLIAAQRYSEQHGSTDIILSTDSEAIKNSVRELNCANIDLSYTRPDHLATDEVGKLDAIVDAKNYAEQTSGIKYDYVMDLDVTSPLRNLDDLNNALKALQNNDEALNIFSVSPANRNPYFNMLEENDEGFYNLCKPGTFLARQATPKVYDANGSFYIFKPKFFESDWKTVITTRTIVFEVPHLCFDLDNPIDFDFMTYLIENDKLDFKLPQ